MYSYDQNKLKELVTSILKQNLSIEAFDKLTEKCAQIACYNKQAFFTAFTAAPRLVGKSPLSISMDDEAVIKHIRKDYTIAGYTADRLARLYILLHLPAENKAEYVNTINRLFPAAEMNELVALYSALPLLAYSEEWIFRATEGIRSNIGSVLEAIICNNPFPSESLDEPAWNQLVLKAFFTEKPVDQIIGLNERTNPKLADTLTDFAHERRAAHRKVPIELWQLVAPFMNQQYLEDIKWLAETGDEDENKAAIEACRKSNFPPAKTLLNQLLVTAKPS